MMKDRFRKTDFGGLLVLLLFAVFSVCILSLLLTGANVYQKIVQRDQEAFDRRTAVQYLEMRVHQSDRIGSIHPGSFDGELSEEGDTLLLTEDIGGLVLVTRIYCLDGHLRELYGISDAELSPEAGEEVAEAQSVSFSLKGKRLRISLTDENGENREIIMCLKSGEVETA